MDDGNTPSEQPHANDELQDVKKQLTGYERSTLKWTRVVVVINVLTCLFVGLQWHEMKSGSNDTHTLAEAAKKQADKMSDVSSAADKIRESAAKMVIQDQRIADNAENSLAASNRQSTAALDATIENARRDQRPYLIVDVPVFNQPSITADHEITANINFRNIGRTPALKILHNLRMESYRASTRDALIKFMDGLFTELRGKDQKGRREIEASPYPEEDVAPQATQFFTSPAITLSPDDVTRLAVNSGPEAGDEALFYVGVLSYTDASHSAYKTEYCYFYFGDNPRIWHICDHNNTIQ
jgi:hypothetical protein